MNLSVYFLISVLLSKARSAFYINKDGVTFEYSLNFQNKCRSHIGRFVFFHGLSIAQCAEECALRPKCAALNYRRRATVCELFSTAEEGDTHIGDCIFMRTTDINVQQNPCGTCIDGEVCDTSSQQCVIQECQPATVPENGYILGNVHTIGGKIKYVCTDSKEVVNAVCLSNGQWSATTNCTTGCGSVPSILHGTIVQSNPAVSVATVTCDTGYLATVATINCTASGNWENVSCDPISCGVPPPFSNGNIVSYTGTVYLDTASVVCDTNFESSSDTISCLDSGTWGDVNCTAIDCGSVPSILHGTIVQSNPAVGVATVTCDTGYLATVATINCTASGDWESASCDPISCGVPPPVTNGNIVSYTGTVYLDTASVVCDTNFESSSDTISCLDSGTWGDVSCTAIDCGTVPSILHGTIVQSNPAVGIATVTCDTGYLATVATINCASSGDWESASCDPISCGVPPSVTNGNVDSYTGTVYQETASISCDTNFEASTDTISCQASGNWETVSCNAADCYVNNVWDYAGTRNVTPSGYPCDLWTNHIGDYRVNVEWMPESSIADAKNYCRQPSSYSWNIWCFSTHPSYEYELCGISQC